jgi:hypothetical protein
VLDYFIYGNISSRNCDMNQNMTILQLNSSAHNPGFPEYRLIVRRECFAEHTEAMSVCQEDFTAADSDTTRKSWMIPGLKGKTRRHSIPGE